VAQDFGLPVISLKYRAGRDVCRYESKQGGTPATTKLKYRRDDTMVRHVIDKTSLLK